MSTISTHVLDTVLGKPAAQVVVRLEKQESGGWIEVSRGGGTQAPWTERVQDISGPWVEISRGVTDADGRCRGLANGLSPGEYRLVFGTGEYLRSQHRSSIYPEVVIAVSCSGEEHYHLPLLLSDNSYTTYRGS